MCPKCSKWWPFTAKRCHRMTCADDSCTLLCVSVPSVNKVEQYPWIPYQPVFGPLSYLLILLSYLSHCLQFSAVERSGNACYHVYAITLPLAINTVIPSDPSQSKGRTTSPEHRFFPLLATPHWAHLWRTAAAPVWSCANCSVKYHPPLPFLRRKSTPAVSPSPEMLELLAYLQDPELVARFQRRCGLFLVEAAHHSRGKTSSSAGTPVHADKSREQLRGRWDHQDNNSNYKHKENGYAAGVSRPLLSIF